MTTVEESIPFDSSPIDQLARRRLSSTASHHSATTGEPSHHQPLQQCHACGSIKKPPPSLSPSFQEPAIQQLQGFRKLPFPPPLYRTFSDPSGSGSYKRKSPTSPYSATGRASSNGSPNVQESPTTPPLSSPSPVKPMFPPPLYRTASDPTGSGSCKRKSPTPPYSATRKASNVQESPTAMRLKRMKDGMREMSQWCNLLVDQEDNVPQENNILKEDETESGKEAASEESVWVERKGKCLILHFRCPCGKGYQVLLHGDNCYYKLTNF